MWLVVLWLIQFFCTHSTLLFIDSIYPTLFSNTTSLSSAFLSQHRKFVCSHPRKWVFLSGY